MRTGCWRLGFVIFCCDLGFLTRLTGFDFDAPNATRVGPGKSCTASCVWPGPLIAWSDLAFNRTASKK